MTERTMTEEQGGSKAEAVLSHLDNLSLFEAAAVLLSALSEVVDQANDRDTMWEAILAAIEEFRSETIQ